MEQLEVCEDEALIFVDGMYCCRLQLKNESTFPLILSDIVFICSSGGQGGHGGQGGRGGSGGRGGTGGSYGSSVSWQHGKRKLKPNGISKEGSHLNPSLFAFAANTAVSMFLQPENNHKGLFDTSHSTNWGKLFDESHSRWKAYEDERERINLRNSDMLHRFIQAGDGVFQSISL